MNEPGMFYGPYAAPPAGYDEMWSADGRIRPHWQSFFQALTALGPDEMARRRTDAERMLRENGVTYNIHGDPDGLNRAWRLDLIPLIIDNTDWDVIEKGLIQRARLLDMILADIYGPRDLIKKGLLPLELIFSHSGFLRACDGLPAPGDRRLLLYAADVARGPDGRFWVLSDRTQAPSGAGYALENRTAMTRILPGLFRDTQVHRLSHFFRDLQSALAAASPRKTDEPRTVILTPGPRNETYFEHAYLASYLGYTLVQGEDLTVRNGEVKLKSLDGLGPVDIVLRRVDDHFCDPLELRGDSLLGVAGLLEALRQRRVAAANPPGSSVLENPGLMAFLPAVAAHLLKEDLILPSAATWWCGQAEEREHVLGRLQGLAVKTISRGGFTRTVFGPDLSPSELDGWREKIRQRPHLYVGQEIVDFSTSPTLVDGRFEPRRTVLRSFLVADGDGYIVMPGGLTRSAAERDSLSVANRAGGISKDTWVLAPQAQEHISLWRRPGGVLAASRGRSILTSRAAENLMWTGRYAERAEETARLLRTLLFLLTESERIDSPGASACLRLLLQSLTRLTATYPGFTGEGSGERLDRPHEELRGIILDTERAGGLSGSLRAFSNASYAVRDQWSTDTWRVVDGITEDWNRLQIDPPVDLHRMRLHLDRLVSALMAFSGLTRESMIREQEWLLLDIGRRIERALLLIVLIRGALTQPHDPQAEPLVLETVLDTTENLIAYRRRYRSYLRLEMVLDLMLLDDANPRSLGYQLSRLERHIARMPRDRGIARRLSQEERAVLDAHTRLRLSDTSVLARPDGPDGGYASLDRSMSDLYDLLVKIAQALTLTYFSHSQGHRQLIATTAPPEPTP